MFMNPLLSGVRVLDLSRLLPGPFCTLYLAQLGAEVIKIEEPKGGDYARLSPELFDLVNRGKKSITLDLRKPEAVEQFLELVVTADVVLDSFRPGVMEKLGCGYDTLKKLNPKLVYAALTGYGHTGPYRDRPGHDMNYRGYAGELAQNGPAGGAPLTGNFQVADLAGGALTAVIGILAALMGAQKSGQGSFVDVAMLDGTLALQVMTLASLRATGKTAPRGEDVLSGAMANYATYVCADGRYIALGAVEYKFFAKACQLAGRPELLKLSLSPGEKGRPLKDGLAELFKSKTRDEWEVLLAHEDTCVSAILDMEEVLNNPQVQARGMVQQVNGKPAFAMPIQFSNAITQQGESPKLGAHNAEVLGALTVNAKRAAATAA
ncbi:MAG: CaiB/BaiF CoA transferase family protein [Stenotrophobium sp.]